MTRGALSLLVAAGLLMALGTAFAAVEPTQLEKDLQRYWGDKREPPSVKRRLHPRGERTEVALTLGMVPDDAFRSYLTPGLSVSYHLSEYFSLGASGSLALPDFSELGGFLDSRFPKNDTLDREEQLVLLAEAEAGWLPFYGKLSLLGIKIAHFDLGVYGGLGIVQTRFNEDDGAENTGFTVQGEIGFGMRLHPVKWLTLRVDYREHFYPSRKDGEGIQAPSVVSFGIGTMFPYPEDRP